MSKEGEKDFFSGVKWPGCEVDHLLPSKPELKNAWSYTSSLPAVFMA